MHFAPPMVRCRPTANPPFCKQEHGAALPSAQPIITMPIQDTLPVFLWPTFAFSVVIPYSSFVEDKFNNMASHTQFIENRSNSYHSIPSWRAAAEQLVSYWTIKWILQENKYLCSQISVSWGETNGAKPSISCYNRAADILDKDHKKTVRQNKED